MTLRSTILVFTIGALFSCQTIMRHHMGIKSPKIEKEKTVISFTEKKKIGNSYFLKKEKIFDAYIGPFPKIYVFDKNGYQVILPRCYEMIEENINRLADTIPDKLSPEPFRDKFVQETVQIQGDKPLSAGNYDYEVFLYWSVWLGKFNVKKLHTAQATIDAINQIPHHKKIVLIPLNFDFIEESGWTEQTVEAEVNRIAATKQNKQ